MSHLRIPRTLLKHIRRDLRRRHEFAHERIGYLLCRSEGPLIIALDYLPLLDEEYVPNEMVGAEFSDRAITRILRAAREGSFCVFHTHEHAHSGRPRFGAVDLESLHQLTPAFFGMSPGPHGALLLSEDEACALLWDGPKAAPTSVDQITEVGFPLSFWSTDASER